ncbi:polysaccharide biosynthesis/export family protein [Sinorhizobium fredii]|uniref:polysaccharide biosynthesis/export family protein n=1 Tax=Rhizobium fredii TaxID=380 RepID=UPI003F812ECB
MDHVDRSEATCDSPAFPCGDQCAAAAPCHRARQAPLSATLRVVPFCLMMLLGSPAKGGPPTDDRLAPQDTVEISVSGWHTLLGGVVEAALLNDTFTIGTGGTLELPEIGRLPAAGLRESELAKLIADRLQARSGSDQRPATTVQRRTPAPRVPSSRVTTPAERPPPAAQLRIAEPAATKQLQTLESEQSRVQVLLSDLAAARMELEKARGEARAARQAARDASIRHNRSLAAERQRAATVTQELNAARADLEAMKVRLEHEANAARDWETAVATVTEARELVARDRAKRAELEENLLTARKEVDAIKTGALSAGRQREDILRRDLAAARRDLDATRRAADDAGAQARKLAAMVAEQGRALINERRRAEGFARDLTIMRREIERLETKSAGAIRSKAAALRARNAAVASLTDAKRALDEERRKLGAYERDLAVARQSAAALVARAKLAAEEQAAAVQARTAAEAAAMRTGEALALEREKGRSLARGLDTAALRARSAAEASLVDARRALNEERRKLGAYERDLAVARQSAAALEARADLAAEEQAAAVQARKAAEAVAMRTREALALEREKGRSLARDLDAARQERDAAREELVRSSAARSEAFGDERERSNGRGLAVERKEVDLPKGKAERPTASIERRRNVRDGNHANERAKPVARKRAGSAGGGGSLEIRKVELGKPAPSVRSATVLLPDALLPRRPPMLGRW